MDHIQRILLKSLSTGLRGKNTVLCFGGRGPGTPVLPSKTFSPPASFHLTLALRWEVGPRSQTTALQVLRRPTGCPREGCGGGEISTHALYVGAPETRTAPLCTVLPGFCHHQSHLKPHFICCTRGCLSGLTLLELWCLSAGRSLVFLCGKDTGMVPWAVH